MLLSPCPLIEVDKESNSEDTSIKLPPLITWSGQKPRFPVLGPFGATPIFKLFYCVACFVFGAVKCFVCLF